MANEANVIEVNPEVPPITRTVGATVQISKGALLVLSNPNTIAESAAGDGSTATAIFGGIANAAKSSTDTRTTVGAHMHGQFDILSAGLAISAGRLVVISGANTITSADLITGGAAAAVSGGLVVGRITEDASAGGERVVVDLDW